MSNKTHSEILSNGVWVITDCDNGACSVSICDSNKQNCKPLTDTCQGSVCVTANCDSADNCSVTICNSDKSDCSTSSVTSSGSSSDNGGSNSIDSFNTVSYVLFTCVLLFLLVGLPWIFRMYDFSSKWVVYGILALVSVALSCITTFAWQDKPDKETTRKWIMSPVLLIAIVIFIFACYDSKDPTHKYHTILALATSSILLVSASILYGFY